MSRVLCVTATISGNKEKCDELVKNFIVNFKDTGMEYDDTLDELENAGEITDYVGSLEYGEDSVYVFDLELRDDSCEDKENGYYNIAFKTKYDPLDWIKEFIKKAKDFDISFYGDCFDAAYDTDYYFSKEFNHVVEISEEEVDERAVLFELTHSDSDNELHLRWFGPTKPYYVRTEICEDEEDFDDWCDYREEEDMSANGCSQEFLNEHNITIEEYEEMMYKSGNTSCWNCWNCENCHRCYNCQNCRDCEVCNDCKNIWGMVQVAELNGEDEEDEE